MTIPVSICIPVFNGEDHIREAIESVLAQTWTDFELVVVDQNSTDRTVEIVESFDDARIKLVHNRETKGLAPNWTRAVEETSGELVKMVCANDALAPECVERQVADLRAHPSAVLAACRRDVIDESSKVILRNRGLAGMRGLVPGGTAITRCVRTGTNAFGEPPAVMIRGDVWKACLPFSDRYPFMIDVEMWLRVLERGDLVAQREPLSRFRLHASSVSTNSGSQQAREARALFRDVRGRTRVRPQDAALGAVNAELLRWARALVYRRLRVA
jgi:glycosyltransferase involved in cell wall biosynthesis